MNSQTNTIKEENDGSEYSFTDTDFEVIARIANEKYGLFLQKSKKPLVYSRLARRLRLLNLGSFFEYCNLLGTPAGNQEQVNLLSALTTNVTHFFRERHHFEQLRGEVIPRLLECVDESEGIRIWSAACSAGQEAYCLAAIVLDVCPDAAKRNVKILATDVDPFVIETARQGRYPIDQMDAIDTEFRATMIDPQNTNDSHLAMKENLRELISFGELNLMHDWPMRRRFDVIMCRNAAIYFDKATQRKLWSRFGEKLKPNGNLIIGHSERLSGVTTDNFKSVGVTSYQRIF